MKSMNLILIFQEYKSKLNQIFMLWLQEYGYKQGDENKKLS